jgi:hypothetical protein
MQPLSCFEPHALHRAEFQPQGGCSFFVSESEEVFNLNQFAGVGIYFIQTIQELINGNSCFEFCRTGTKKLTHVFERRKLCIRPLTRVIDKLSTHRTAGDCEKMRSILPVTILRSNEPEVNLVD